MLSTSSQRLHAGVKFNEVTEITNLDSYGKKETTRNDNGAHLPRVDTAEGRDLDKGIPRR